MFPGYVMKRRGRTALFFGEYPDDWFKTGVTQNWIV